MTDTDTIRHLNDLFRNTLQGGRLMLTNGVLALPEYYQGKALSKMSCFDDFNADNDPHGEHDFGAFQIEHLKFFWKIDYYDKDLCYGSENPTDPDVTERVLTLMLAEEY